MTSDVVPGSARLGLRTPGTISHAPHGRWQALGGLRIALWAPRSVSTADGGTPGPCEPLAGLLRAFSGAVRASSGMSAQRREVPLELFGKSLDGHLAGRREPGGRRRSLGRVGSVGGLARALLRGSLEFSGPLRGSSTLGNARLLQAFEA
eukprot:118728-Alexandrium_andersonii.AAC.1